MIDVNEYLKSGYRASDIDIKEMKPHYFSQRAWNSTCEHWGTPEFNMKSEKGKKAQMKVEFVPRNGAKPYDQRRGGISSGVNKILVFIFIFIATHGTAYYHATEYCLSA